MNIKKKTINLVIMALLTAILLIMSLTPLGYLNIGPLAITFNMIPVAIGAILMGPMGGGILGFVFGMTSYLQAAGVMGVSPLGTILFAENPFLTFIVCVVSRTLDGIIIGFVCKGMSKVCKNKLPVYGVTGFLAAALNTLLFMGTMILCFADLLVEKGFWEEGKNVILFVAGFVGVNALVEMGVATVLTAVIGFALYKAKLVNVNTSK